MTDEISTLRARIEELEFWIEGECLCPCCGSRRQCDDECTMALDDPVYFERMTAARGFLYAGRN